MKIYINEMWQTSSILLKLILFLFMQLQGKFCVVHNVYISTNETVKVGIFSQKNNNESHATCSQ